MDIMERIARHERGEEQLVVHDDALKGLDLRGRNLTGANLSGADLFVANLTDANLSGADLTDANLTGANLTGADLTDANLTGADLTDANLTDANLSGADLDYASWTFSCATLGVKTDDKQSRQHCYHWLRNNIDKLPAAGFTQAEMQKLANYANGFHRVLRGDVKKIEVK